jgi:hypothetical protein
VAEDVITLLSEPLRCFVPRRMQAIKVVRMHIL